MVRIRFPPATSQRIARPGHKGCDDCRVRRQGLGCATVAAKELSRLFPSPVASDDAVLPQLCDGGGVDGRRAHCLLTRSSFSITCA